MSLNEQTKRNFHMIFSVSANSGLGFQNTKPWNIPDNIKFFKKITTYYRMPGYKASGINAVIMGRKTFEYILNSNFLWDRINVIVT